MSTLPTKFRGDISVLENTLRDLNVADDAGIRLYKLEKMVVAADGTIPFTGHQSFGGFRCRHVGSPVVGDDAATKSYVDSIFSGCEHPIDYVFHYLKQTTGAPYGAGTENEICLNSIDNNYYQFSGGSWGSPTPLIEGKRFLFGLNGGDTSGTSGTYISDAKIYEYSSTTGLDSYYGHNGCTVLVRNPSYHCSEGSGWVYDEINVDWVQISGSGTSFTTGNGLIKIIDTLNVLIDGNTFEFNSSNEIKLKDNSIKSNHLDTGTGPGQISTDDIPEGLVNKYYPPEIDGGFWNP